MRLSLIFTAALALGAAGCSGPKAETAKAPEAIDRMPRAEVESIVHDYLMRNPEVLVAAFNELQVRENAKTYAKLIDNKDDPVVGNPDAPITMVEFFDYNCGYCKAANPWVFDKIDSKRGDVKVIFKEYPVLAQSSHLASTAALAARKQGKYREMHLALIKSHDLSPETIDKIATSIGLNLDKLHTDMKSADIAAHIDRVLREGQEADVQGTPGFFINGQFLNGYNEAKLDEMIAEARKKEG